MNGGNDNDGGWIVVRGKGKGKNRHNETSLKRARDTCCPIEALRVVSPGAAQTPPVTTDAAALPATAADRGALDLPSNAGSLALHGFHNKRRQGPAQIRERTPAEQCEQLLTSIHSCRREVADSPFFARLMTVLSEVAATYLNRMPYSSYIPANMSYMPRHAGGSGMLATGRLAAAAEFTGTATVMDDSYHNRIAWDERSKDGDGDGMDMRTSPGGYAAGGSGGSCNVLTHWHCVRSLVVYGLGSPHLSRVSRYQLALVLLLRDQVLRGLTSPVHLYDPAFDDVDRLALEQLGLQVVDVDEGAARRVIEPTFFYMPHCERELYDALLRANWNCGAGSSSDSHSGGGNGLPLLAVLGNSFRQYLERWEMRAGRSGAGGQRANSARPPPPPEGGGGGGAPGPVVRSCLEGAVVEVVTPELRFPVPSAFNCMSLHLFPPSERLEQLLAVGPDEVVDATWPAESEGGKVVEGGGSMAMETVS
ncbi:hypothetical protein VaNZ11_016645 [Volvox africanus]|uniref:SRR1-like domain-containing protein n=1 Tax=Volvox africanus TaxID=51714 RepID=A0ABQ5SP88_9CHLO|nr:hypothetical protein VaNZ11_016645 [Volvox africanus]